MLILLFLSYSAVGLADGKKEEEMAKQASDHFQKGDFLIAEKFYAQLASTNPENIEYNFKYGACILQTSDDKESAIKYLRFAVKNSSDVGEPHYYLGKALQYTYRFNEALKNYNSFRASITTAKADKLEVDAHIKQCKTSIKLIEEFSPVKVVSSKVMNRNRFEKAYKLGAMNRKILVKPADFNTKEDFTVKKGDPQLIVHGKDQNTLFFSGYKYGNRFAILERDIFMVKKSEDGIWSDFQDVGPFINSNFDEDYPYLHPNGQELYFSSKGHGGLGGYDIFKSQLDTITGLWGKPVNLGFAINSAYDDILYVVDGNNNVAYFSSNRENTSTEMTVYKIIPSENVDNYVLFKGKVVVEGGINNKVDIKVINTQGQLIGKYFSDPESGTFLFPLAELETYKFEFTYDDSISKSFKAMIPLKSSQSIVFQNVIFKIEGVPNIESAVDLSYELTTEEKVFNFQSLANMSINQKIDVDFGVENADTVNGIEGITPKDPELLLKNALAYLDELKLEKKELNDQINASYVLTHNNTKTAVEFKQELKKLAMEVDANTPEGKQKIEDKQVEYNQAIKKIVDVLLFAENQENTFFQKEKEEGIATEYVEAINKARSGQEIDLLSYRKKMAVTTKELDSKNKSKIIELNEEIIELKDQRSKVKSEQFKLKSDIALIKDAVLFYTEQMNKTKKVKIRTDFANKITSLEKAKKKKSPISAIKQEELSTLDSLLRLKEKQLITYSSVDLHSAQPTMKRVNLSERETITRNAKSTVNKSKLAGTLDQFVVQNAIMGSDQIASGPTFEFNDEGYTPSEADLTDFFATNLNDANDEQIHQFSKNIFGIKNITNGDFEDEQIAINEQLAANNFREALMMRQEIEKKKKQLAIETEKSKKQSLREEIKIIEAHLFKMEFEAMVSLTKSNDVRQKEKEAAVELAFLLNPGIQIGGVAQLFDESKTEWDEVTMLKQRLRNNSEAQQRSNISKEILVKQTSVINKLIKTERLIKGEPTDIPETIVSTDNLTPPSNPDSESPINFGTENTNPAIPTNPPVNNYGRNGSKKSTKNSFEGVDISAYGSNSTMRVKKGILITSNIKYDISTKVPIDIQLGTGVIYKVQVGAFRNKINAAIFNGITPLSGEDAGNGVIRYTAGIFKSLTGANMAKGKIVDIGYSDAFVVAFFNGRRISLTKAENLISSSSESQKGVYVKQKSEELAALKKAGITETDAYISKSSLPNPINKFKSLNIPNSGKTGENVSSTPATKSNNNNVTSGGITRSTNAAGIYYTVQIGVYSTNKTSSDLFGIAPLVTHTNGRGLIRYSTGIFKTFEQANKRKSEARTQGAEDAYVAVYRDGVRISLEEAQGN